MLRKTVLVRALAIAFSAASLTAMVVPAATAQSNVSGSVYGKVAPGSGSSVVLKNLDTNQSRTVPVDQAGSFSASAMPIGRYSVTVMKGSSAGETSTVEVLAGQGVEAAFEAPTTGVQSVKITGRAKRIDVSSANNGATFTARELAKLPIAQNVDAIIQLAPNTTRADSRYAGGASFAGGGASENAYYINGFPVTNPLTQLGSSELPFGAIAQAQILTGGYGAEFGRSVGGVVNITTKGGTNTWEAGAMASIEPKKLRSDRTDIYYPTTGAFPKTDDKLYRRRSENTQEKTVVGAYLSGPIIKDKLFMFVSAESTETKIAATDSVNGIRIGGSPAGAWLNQDRKVQRYLGKLDWNLTDNHRLELSLIGDSPKVHNAYSDYTYGPAPTFTGTHTGVFSSDKTEKNINDNGAAVQILKYTGNISDAFTVQALYGRSKSKHIEEFTGYNPTLYTVTTTAGDTPAGVTINNPQTITGNLVAPGSNDRIESFRLDLEYKLGNHTIGFGLDNNKLTSNNAGEVSAGGGNWTYSKIDPATTPLDSFDLGGGMSKGSGTSGSPYGLQGFYVTKNLFTTVTNAYSNQNAQYIQDKWQVTPNVVVTGGIRIEGFDNQNGDKVKYLEQKNQVAPRLNVIWDVNGDASTKIFASAGRYHLQIPTHLAVRGAGRATNTTQAFAYTGVDAKGVPTGLTQLSAPASANNEYGQAKEPQTLSSVGLKPTFQDEITIGLEKQLSANMNFGVKATYRTLGSTIDDFCDGRPFTKYAKDHSISTAAWQEEIDAGNPAPYFGCANFNPGKANAFYVDFAGTTRNGGTAKNLTLASFTKEDLGFPAAKRVYKAVDVFAEHPMRNGWYSKVNYTWSRSEGNTEGQTLSDVGQTDVAATQTWDYKELAIGAYGRLPNDRTHQLKGYGFYELTPQITVGANFLIATGRPKSCLGRFLFDGTTPNYSNGPHYCGGNSVATNVLSPRGTRGNLPTDSRVDLNIVYRPAMVKGLGLKMDVFNFLNRQAVESTEERWNSANNRRSTFGRTLSTTSPRLIRLTAEYNTKF
ncbi:TonB-dependent receptor [Massilia sp. TSP1-1-2]|uniref:TonB-dependent receptor n=1 Tax=Massilia sp. TSP1-1-2 TaxID=2804649 RepID=UPI003CF791BF